MTIWFTSDNHFGHSNILAYAGRDFASVDEMNDTMITNWNKIVKDTDIVYHLGDFTLGNFKAFKYYMEKLNGIVMIIPGGHDKRWISEYAKEGPTSKFSVLPPLYTIKALGMEFVLCHYPLFSWEKSLYGSIHLHGHSHGSIGCIGISGNRNVPLGEKPGIRFDVGVDCSHFRPISVSDIINRIDAYEGVVKV